MIFFNSPVFILCGFLIIFGCFAPYIFTRKCDIFPDFHDKGQIGDTIGGIMGPFIAIAGVIMTYAAFRMQVEANKIQTQQLLKSFKMGQMEDEIDSRNALQLLSVDIKMMILNIKQTKKDLDKVIPADNVSPTDVVNFKHLSKQTIFRYNTIDRNLVYNAFVNFVEINDEKKCLTYFKKIYVIMDLCSEKFDIFYSKHQSYKDEIIKTENDILNAFNSFFYNLGHKDAPSGYSITIPLWTEFKKRTKTAFDANGSLNIDELREILEDGKFLDLYNTCFVQYQYLLKLINSLYAQTKMMIETMQDVRKFLDNKYRNDTLAGLNGKIKEALEKHTIESIRDKYAKQTD